MTRRRLLGIVLSVFSVCTAANAEDPGLDKIGSFGVQLIYATNGDASAAGERAKDVPKEIVAELKKFKDLQFESYRFLGSDKKPILKGYENWASPLKPSKEILISFESRKRIDKERLQMVLEYWQGSRKILTTDPVLTKGKSLYLLGPEWRKGRLILEVKILDLKD